MCAVVYRQRHLMKATEVTTGLAERNGSLLPGIWRDSLHITCRLTACTPGSAPGPALDNDYGKTFFCLFFHPCRDLEQTKHDFSFNRVTLPRTYLDSILFEDRHFFCFQFLSLLFVAPPIQQMGPEVLCLRIICLCVHTYVHAFKQRHFPIGLLDSVCVFVRQINLSISHHFSAH